MKKLPAYLVIIGIVIELGLLNSCKPPSEQPGPEPQQSPTIQIVPVETEVIGTGEILSAIETTANIIAEEDISVYPKINGQIEAVFVEEGDILEKNQVMAKIEDKELNLSLQQSEVRYQQLNDNFNKIKSLYESRMISEQSYLDAKYDLENAGVALKIAQLELSYTLIKSPIQGILTERNVSNGDLIQNAKRVFRMYNPKSLIVNVFVPEQTTSRLNPDMPALIYPESIPHQSFEAEIARINPAVDPQTGTVKVTLEFLEGHSVLKPGMFVRVKLIIEKKTDTILIPKKALIRRNGQTLVYVMEADGRASSRALEIGLEDSVNVEAKGGVSPGERLIIVGQQGLENGAFVSDDSFTTPTIARNTPDPL